MKRIISTIAVALAAVFAVSCGSSEQQANMKKIVFPGDYPDPSIMRDGKDFYMTHSSFTYYPGLLVWHSTNLVDWEPISRAVQDQPYSIYAPEICKVGDKFYIYYPTSSGQNFVVMADDPHGPWSEPVLINVRGIDPGHVLAENGKHYLYTNNGHMVELTDDGLATAGPNQKVYDGWDFPSDWETEGVWLESPKLVKHGDYWYLITAEGGTAGPPTSHMVVVARSTSALGPWENSPYNPMVHTYSADEEWWSKGHGTIFDDADGNWYIVYHSYRNSYHTLGRTSIIESVIWTEDGWPMLADPGLDFEEDVEGSVQFANLRDFHNPLMWAKWEPGFEGGELWTITAVDRAYEVCAEFECAEGAKAGLYLFYNEDAYVGVQAEDSHFFLRIVNDHNNVTTYKSLDGKEWNVVEEGVDVSEYHHNVYKGFFALRPSVLVGEGVTVKAFDYKVL
ncbi:MAG: family 43 glycosylhydrolase [Bacteroidales bacterium]|nr:family 43 glycosylhydrolase [Candidatus Cryptobacteroides caccocaballi]